MTITIDGQTTVSGKIFEPRVGVWWSDIEYQANEVDDPVLDGSATLSFGATEFVGATKSIRSVNDAGIVSVKMLGGSGQLDDPLEAQHFRNLTRRTLVADLTNRTGDTLDDSSSAEVLDVRMAHWTRPRTLGHRYLSDIAEHGQGVWRVLRNGNLWIGRETWPEVSLDYTEVTKGGTANGVVIQPDDDEPLVRPGTTFQGQRVAEVFTVWSGTDLRQQIVFEDTETPGYYTRSIQSDVVDWQIRTLGTQLDLSALYSCRVTSQSSDLTKVDIILDHPRVKARGAQGVPIRYGMPGIKATLRAGAKVLVGWENADPSRPYVSIWQYEGVTNVDIAPELNANAGVRTIGSGVSSVTSATRCDIEAPLVNIGPTPALDAARKTDLVIVTLPLQQAGPFPVVATPSPSPWTAPGQIVTGNAAVKQ